MIWMVISLIYNIKKSRSELSEARLESYLKYSEIIQWGRKYPIKYIERFYGIALLDHQRYVFMNSWLTPRNVWCQGRGSGKALSLNTNIPTPIGNKKMSEIQVGDYVFDENAQRTKVTFMSDVFYNHDCYEIIFSNNDKIIADSEHLWLTNNGIISTLDIFKEFKIDKFHIPCSKLDIANLYNVNMIKSVKKTDSVPTKCIQVDNPTSLYLCGNHFTVTHNTTLIAPFVMAKSNLFPKHQTYIMAGVGSQAQECFLKIEKIAKREIGSFTGLTDFFMGEIEANITTSDGFIHSPASYTYKLFNDSRVNSLNGNYDNNRSKQFETILIIKINPN